MDKERAKRIGEFLISIGVLTEKQVMELLSRQANESPHKRFGDLVIEAGVCSREELERYILEHRN